jgi:alpha-beta hydrolase superfamily lysophospholipase
MSAWWSEYIGKIPNAGVFYPKEDWLSLYSSNGNKLMTYRFHHENPKAIVFIFHEMFSDSSETVFVAKFLYEKGYSVLAMDQEGHGKSEGRKGMIKNFEFLVVDSEKFIRKVKKYYPENTPIFLLGGSTGASLVAMLALWRPNLVNGIILLAPVLNARTQPETIFHKLVRNFACCCSCLTLEKLDRSSFSRNPYYESYYQANPWTFKSKLLIQSTISTMNSIKELQNNAYKISVPLVLIQGGNDKFVTPEDSKKFIENCVSSDKEYWYYEQLYHSILFEPEIEEIVTRCADWMALRSQFAGRMKLQDM